MFEKYFTPWEATQCLPLVKAVTADILRKGQRIRSVMEHDANEERMTEIRSLEEEIAGLMRELEELGCFFKDWNFEIGLVDFPAVINGATVMLCWRSDEAKLRWYHGVEDGFAGRKLIPENLLDEELTGSGSGG